MKNLLAVAVLGGTMTAVPWSGASAQDDEKCDAKPRWIAVTVVEGWFESSAPQTLEMDSGEQLLDRCMILGVDWDVRELKATSRRGTAVTKGARTSFSASRSMDDGGWIMYTFLVKETVQQICAAMDDCGDATRSEP